MWVTADTHFNHAKIMQYMERPFADVDAMNNEIVRRWNSVVGEKQTVYHLGDFGFGKWSDKRDMQPMLDLRARLNGKIVLIMGNHDDFTYKLDCWEDVFDYKYIKWNHQKYFLCHYAMRTWRGSHRGTFQLHGHSHGNMPDQGLRQMDVGVDLHNFTPLHLDAVYEILKDRPYIGHHIWGPQWPKERDQQDESN